MSNFGKFISDAVVPPQVDAFEILGYIPTPRQQAFHEASKERLEMASN